MESHFGNHRNYMAYPNKLNCQISQDISHLRDLTVNSNRVLVLSRYVSQLKNKNSAFPFVQNSYEFIINPNNHSLVIGILQFIQNSSFLVSYLQENPQLLATVTFSIKKQWQFLYLINCIIPSLYGFFACQEYAEQSIKFYSEIINRASPNVFIQAIQPFFHSCVTYHFFEAAYGPFIHSILVDENILKNSDKLVSIYANLLIEYITNSIKFLPNEFFKILDLVQNRNWDFTNKKNLIVDNFLLPELKIWSTRLDINAELKDFVYRIIDMISISLKQPDYYEPDDYESNYSSLSSSVNFESMIYQTDPNSSSNLSSFNLGFDLPVQPALGMTRSNSMLKLSKKKAHKLSKESRTLMILMKNLINFFFICPNIDTSLYEMPILYENFTDDIFPQYTQYTLSIYDIQFIASALEKLKLFPKKISSSIFINDSIRPFITGVFYCHVYSHNIISKHEPNNPYLSLFKGNNQIKKNEIPNAKKVKFNISLIDNNIFLKFIKFNKHYGSMFEAYMIDAERNSKSEHDENIERIINYIALMNEIVSQNDRILYNSSFLLETYSNQIIKDFKNQQNLYKKVPFIKIFKKLSSVFDSSNLIQAKKNFYLKLLDLFYKELMGDYWRVLLDFDKFWEELINAPKEKKNLNMLLSANSNFLPFFVDSVALLSYIDNQQLNSRFYIMIYAFNLLCHISRKDPNGKELYELAFHHIKSKEFISTFFVIDSYAIKIKAFQNFCTKDEIDCWDYMKKNIEIFLKQNDQYHKVYISITEYLTAISTSALYNLRE